MPPFKRTTLRLLAGLHKMGAEHVCPGAKESEDRFGLITSSLVTCAIRLITSECRPRTVQGCAFLGCSVWTKDQPWVDGAVASQPYLCSPFWLDSKSLGLLTFYSSSQHQSKYLPQVKRSISRGS